MGSSRLLTLRPRGDRKETEFNKSLTKSLTGINYVNKNINCLIATRRKVIYVISNIRN